jgi:hypothetical protein
MSTLSQLRMMAPAFAAVPDATCNLALEQAARVNKVSAWGPSLYETACIYYALHLVTVWQRGVTGAAGPTTHSKVGEWSQMFGFIEQDRDGMNSTSWGQQYLRLVATKRPFTRFLGVPP